jgi:hypothetical protein
MFRLSAHNNPGQRHQCARPPASHAPAWVTPFPVGVRSPCRSLSLCAQGGYMPLWTS